MKTWRYKIAFCVFIVLISNNLYAQDGSTLSANFHGTPKKIVIINYNTKKGIGKLKRGSIASGFDIHHSSKEYNRNGDEIKHDIIDNYGYPRPFFVSNYNKEGKIIERIHFYRAMILSKTIYSYNSSYLVKEQYYVRSIDSKEDSVYFDIAHTSEYFYNTLNQLILEETVNSLYDKNREVKNYYNLEGLVERKETFENDTLIRTVNFMYDSIGRLTNRENFDKQGSLFSYEKNEYISHGDTVRTERRNSPTAEIIYSLKIYNKNGDLIKLERNYGNDAIRFTREYDYKYDEYTNWVERIPIQKKPIVTVRSIEYYE